MSRGIGKSAKCRGESTVSKTDRILEMSLAEQRIEDGIQTLNKPNPPTSDTVCSASSQIVQHKDTRQVLLYLTEPVPYVFTCVVLLEMGRPSSTKMIGCHDGRIA